MTTYQSEIKTISSSEEVVFGILSDLNYLSKIKDMPELKDKLRDPEFDADSCSFQVDMLGRVGFRIIEREPFNTIKFESFNLPFSMNAWIQLKEVNKNDTRMKLTLKADMPAMIKMMAGNKIEEGINKLADVLAATLNSKL
jgi:carbon monoxide dehydrogenase subunit G